MASSSTERKNIFEEYIKKIFLAEKKEFNELDIFASVLTLVDSGALSLPRFFDAAKDNFPYFEEKESKIESTKISATRSLLKAGEYPRSKRELHEIFDALENDLNSDGQWLQFWEKIKRQLLEKSIKDHSFNFTEAAKKLNEMQEQILAAYRFKVMSILTKKYSAEVGSLIAPMTRSISDYIQHQNKAQLLQKISAEGKEEKKDIENKEEKTFPLCFSKEAIKFFLTHRLSLLLSLYAKKHSRQIIKKANIERLKKMLAQQEIDRPEGIKNCIEFLQIIWKGGVKKYGGSEKNFAKRSKTTISLINAEPTKHVLLRYTGCLLQDLCQLTGSDVMPHDPKIDNLFNLKLRNKFSVLDAWILLAESESHYLGELRKDYIAVIEKMKNLIQQGFYTPEQAFSEVILSLQLMFKHKKKGTVLFGTDSFQNLLIETKKTAQRSSSITTASHWLSSTVSQASKKFKVLEKAVITLGEKDIELQNKYFGVGTPGETAHAIQRLKDKGKTGEVDKIPEFESIDRAFEREKTIEFLNIINKTMLENMSNFKLKNFLEQVLWVSNFLPGCDFPLVKLSVSSEHGVSLSLHSSKGNK